MTTMTEPKRSTQNLTLEVRRVIRGSRQRVFEAWTKPELIEKWFGPEHMTVAKATNDLRVEGKYRIEMEGSTENCSPSPENPKRATAYGFYTEIVPNERLSFTWRGDWGPIEDTHVTVEFKDAPDGTEVILTHTKFANQEMLEGHNKGWNGSLNKLERFISA
jgi:uncharacterized protein YndB with AHSA1/START domain